MPGYIPRQDWQNALQEDPLAGLLGPMQTPIPKLTPATDLGAAAVAAYARRDGINVDEYLKKLAPGPGPNARLVLMSIRVAGEPMQPAMSFPATAADFPPFPESLTDIDAASIHLSDGPIGRTELRLRRAVGYHCAAIGIDDKAATATRGRRRQPPSA